MHRGCPVGEEDGHFFGCVRVDNRIIQGNVALKLSAITFKRSHSIVMNHVFEYVLDFPIRCVPGWVRVMVWNGTLFATHFAEGFGTRDGVFLVAMLELLARYGHEVPDVDFVLQPGDRAKVGATFNGV
jgi:hypothetical protein